jgi:hypothetical protein
MDLFWLLCLSIGGMIVLGIAITISRSSNIGNQNTFLFLEAIIVGFVLFISIGIFLILLYIAKSKEPDIAIKEITDLSLLSNTKERLLDEQTPDYSEN